MEFLIIGCANCSLWNNLYKLDYIFVALNCLKNVSVIHENHLLVKIGLVVLVEVRSLYNLEGAKLLGLRVQVLLNLSMMIVLRFLVIELKNFR